MPVFTDAIEDSAIVVIAKENRLIHIMFFLIPCVLYNTYNYVLIQNTIRFLCKKKSTPTVFSDEILCIRLFKDVLLFISVGPGFL